MYRAVADAAHNMGARGAIPRLHAAAAGCGLRAAAVPRQLQGMCRLGGWGNPAQAVQLSCSLSGFVQPLPLYAPYMGERVRVCKSSTCQDKDIQIVRKGGARADHRWR